MESGELHARCFDRESSQFSDIGGFRVARVGGLPGDQAEFLYQISVRGVSVGTAPVDRWVVWVKVATGNACGFLSFLCV